MAKVIIATEKPFAAPARDKVVGILKAAGLVPVVLEKYAERADLLKAAADCEGMIIRSDKVKMDVLEAAKNLKIVVRAGAGHDNIDKDVKQKIVCENTPGQNSNAVAELAFGMMVYMIRGQFDGKPGTELKGKKLALHAYGNVGKCMAKIAKGFGMSVCAFDPFLKPADMEADGVEWIDKVETLYEVADVLSLHIPQNKDTAASINANLLGRMKDAALIINTARAGIINYPDILKVLEDKPKFRYASDVKPDGDLATENYDALMKFGNRVYFNPKKMGAQTAEANDGAGAAAANQVVALLKEGKEMYRVY